MDQIYLFIGPAVFSGDSHIWAEMYLGGEHFTAPTPFTSNADKAEAAIASRNPGVMIDWLDRDEDIADALLYV
jgi:hypothetical protein